LKINDFVIEKVRVWDVDSDRIDPLSSSLRVRDGQIVSLGEAAREADPSVPRIALPGRCVVPGLIDAHVHLELDANIRSPAEQLAVPESQRLTGMSARAASMLAAGITTTRDCGGGKHREHALRDRINRGEAIGPRVLCCGQPITTPGGHCGFWGGEAETRVEIDRVIALQVEAKSDWIKVMATGGVFTPGSRARDAQFDLSRMLTIVEAANRAGRSVAAHCHGTEGIANAVRSGVRTIEHASFAGPDGFGTALDDSLMREMAESELWVSPTVNAGWGRRIEDEKGEPTAFFRRMSTALRAQRDHGIDFIASTDAGIPGVAHDDLVAGLLAFERFADLRPVDVLRAATCEASRALEISQETGRIEPGMSADFLIIDGDPLEDLSLLRDPEVVVFRGDWLDRADREVIRNGGLLGRSVQEV
jgi:imidazolonepropionase-like amidohydrolase